jgi:hypothetical protein
MQLGRLIEGALEEAGNRYVRDIHEALKPAAVASRSNKPIGDRMILNAAFLVDRERRSVRRAGQGRFPQVRRAPELQVHRPLAAVQLRQHQAEAGSNRADRARARVRRATRLRRCSPGG